MRESPAGDFYHEAATPPMEFKGGHGDPKKNCRELHADTRRRCSHFAESACLGPARLWKPVSVDAQLAADSTSRSLSRDRPVKPLVVVIIIVTIIITTILLLLIIIIRQETVPSSAPLLPGQPGLKRPGPAAA